MGIKDEYTAYCLDEAGAWLLGQKSAPDYGLKRKAEKLVSIRSRNVLDELVRVGGATIKR